MKNTWFYGLCIIALSTLFSNTIAAQGDISLITKQASVDTAFTGEAFTFILTFQCLNDSCKNVVLTDTLEPGLEYVGIMGEDAYAVSPTSINSMAIFYEPGDTFNFSNPGVLTISLGDLAAGESGTMSLSVRFQHHGMVPDGWTVGNTAYISSDNDPNTNNNVASSGMVTAKASSNWDVRKIAQPGNIQGGANGITADTTAVDELTFYTFSFNKFAAGSRDGSFYFSLPAIGQLALDSVLIVDYLDPGLTGANVDANFTTPGYTVVPPAGSAVVGGINFTNTTGRVALVWDPTDPGLDIGPSPYYTGGPNGYGDVDNVCNPNNYPPGYGTTPRCFGGDFRFSFRWRVAVRYEMANGYLDGDSVTNTATLFGANPVTDLTGTLGPIEFQDSAAVCHVVAVIPPGALQRKLMGSGVLPAKEGFINEQAVGTSTFDNDGVIALTNATIVDRLPAETDVERFWLNGVAPGPFTIDIFYSDGTDTTMTNQFTFSIYRAGFEFMIPPGEFVDSIRFVYDTILLPGEAFFMRVFGPILPNRWIDDRNTALQMLVQDPGTQLSGSPVVIGELITDCSFFESDQTERDTSCDEITVGPGATTLGFDKFVDPVSAVLPGDTLTFDFRMRNYFGAQELADLTWHDTLPEFLQYAGDFHLTGRCSLLNTTNLSLNVVNNVNGSNRQLLEFIMDTIPFITNSNANACGVQFKAVVEQGHPAGQSFNDVCIVDVIGPPGGLFYFNSNNRLILDGNNMPGNPPGNCEDAAYLIASLPAGQSRKYADGNVTPGEAGPDEVQLAAIGSTATYRLNWVNSGNAPVSNLKFIDILPEVGDISPLSLMARGSAFSVEFNGNVNLTSNTPITPMILVNSSNNPCREDYVPDEPGPWPPGCVASPFVPIGNIPNSQVRTLAIMLPDTLDVGDSVNVTFEVNLPGFLPLGEANNNYSWVASDAESPLIEIGAESSIVGLAGVDGTLGNRVFCDLDGSGTYDANLDDIPMDGVTLYLYEASTNQLVDSTTLFGGLYEFDTIIPDDYIVVIPADEFQVGGLLEGYSVSPAPAGMPNADLDDDVDHNALSGTGIFTGAIVTAPITISGNEVNNTLDFALNCFSCDIQISAGNPITACSANPVDLTALGAFINGATTAGTWSSSGTGTFSPNAEFGTATTYTFSDQDISNGSVILTLTSEDPDGNGACEAVSASVIITILRVDCGTFPWNGGQ